jgi:hypothetical protein
MNNVTDRVSLPIGIDFNGSRYREVIIDEMTGVDEENMASPKVRNNGSKAITLLLRRCIQEIPGVMPKKTNPMSLCDESIIRKMYAADRDYLMLCIRALSGKSEVPVPFYCVSCGTGQTRDVALSDLEVYEWDDSEPIVEIELEKGIFDDLDKQYKKRLTWKLPTGLTQEKVSELPENQAGSGVIVAGIQSVEGMDHLPTIDDIRKLSLRDRQIIADTITDNAVGVDPKITLPCESCGADCSAEVDFAGFFSLAPPKTQTRSSGGKTGRRLRKRP